MIKFDPSLVDIEIVQLKAVSTALGGSISIIDTKRSTPTKEAHARIEVPMSLARSFIVRHKKITKYLKPVFTAIVRYDGRVIALERHPLGSLGKLEDEGLFGKKKWVPDCQDNLDKLIIPLVVYSNARDWYFDGRYAYSFDGKNLDEVVRVAPFMSKTGQFRKLQSLTIDLQEMQTKKDLDPAERTCLAFVAANGQYAISAPIWKDLANVGATQMRKSRGDDANGEMALTITETVDDGFNARNGTVQQALDQFDTIDEHLAVNVNFALKAGKEIGKLFGYEAVEPLQLPRLMIEMHTVNLPNVPKEVKATYDIGLNFTHAVAWLLGLQKRTNTLESYLVVRSLLKYLTSKGIFRRNIFDADRVMKEGKSITDVPQLDLDELTKVSGGISKLSLAAIIEQTKNAMSNKKRLAKGLSSVGTLMNEV